MIASALLACTLSAADGAYVQKALDGWATVTRDLLRLPGHELPWMVLYSRSCAYHVAPDTSTPLGRSAKPLASPRLNYAGRPLDLHVLPVTDTVSLPSGAQIPASGRAFTSVYENAGVAKPFFATALPDVWAHDPKYANDPEDWRAFVLEVLSHELVHTRQIVAIRSRLEEVQRRFPRLPTELNDDWLQKTFEAVPGFEPTVRAEIALLHQAAGEPDAGEARSLARTALALIRARRQTYYADSAPAYAAVEDVFLNMEGVACWSAFKLALTKEPTATPAKLLDRFRGNRRWWSQEAGLALFLVLDRFVPGWTERVFPPELASPLDLLDAALPVPAR